jgi:hypothetical protein
MLFFKKKQPIKQVCRPKPKFPVDSLRVVGKWDNYLARYVYDLEQYYYVMGSWDWHSKTAGSFNKAWASKTANHYGLKIEYIKRSK